MPCKHLSLFLLAIALLVGTGCSAIKQQLRPLVCDCQASPQQGATDEELARALAIHHVENACVHADDESSAQAHVEELAEEDTPAAEPPRAQATAFADEEVDPLLTDAPILVDSDQAKAAFEEEFHLGWPDHDGAAAFRGIFRRDHESSLAIYLPGKSLTFYGNGQPLASMDLSAYQADLDLDGLDFAPAQALELVGDGITELQLIQARADDEGLTYYISIYRIIGSFVGTIFHKAIARRSDDGELRRLADIRILRGQSSRIIQWIPLDERGQIDGEPVEYEWNKWEGVYRPPGPPPTAPKREQRAENRSGESEVRSRTGRAELDRCRVSSRAPTRDQHDV